MSNNKQQPKPEKMNNQFSNTEPLTHAQRVAIANTMSNNKQSSVEWLFCQLIDKEYKNPNDTELISIIEQAKAMYKEEKIKFATDFFFWWYNQTSGTNTVEAVEKYYNETFNTYENNNRI